MSNGQQYRENASRLHKKVGGILFSTDAFKHHKIYQEYPVNKINPNYIDSHFFDWVIPDLKLVIECHGIQHTKPTAFKKEDIVDTVQRFISGVKRDRSKEEAALTAGYTYIVIDYTEEDTIDANILLAKINKHKDLDVHNKIDKKINPLADRQKQKAKEYRQQYLNSDTYKERLEQARKYRKERYQSRKDWERRHNDETD